MMKRKRLYHVAIVGATGAVGRKMMAVLEERNFPVGQLTLLASARSRGQSLPFRGREVEIYELNHESFFGVDIALFSAGGSISKEFGPVAVRAGAIVVDNSSAFRMEKDIPLVVPEVNSHAIGDNPGIIANPNCSTIQMVVVLKPIHDEFKIRRIVVSTYQSVSGSGQKAIDELKSQIVSWGKGKPLIGKVYPHQIAFNCLPHIDLFLDNGYTKEEMKMVNETRKILEDDTIQVSPTTVRVPVFYAHSEAVNVETKNPINSQVVRELLGLSPGIVVIDDPAQNHYPLATDATDKDAVYVGRIRDDISRSNAVNFWIVSDNLRKGAATNAIQIAEELVCRVFD